MKTRTKVIALGVAAALAAGTYTYAAFSAENGFGPPFIRGMGSAMMGGGTGGPGMMGMAHDSATMAQLGVIHELFVNHDKITRTVTNLPDGIRTITESSDPRIAQFLQEHVGDMLQRVDANDDPGLPIESPALRSIFKNHEKIETKVETTENGVVVIQTSTDPATVAALQEHAGQVTDFVKDGMIAMRTAMMKSMAGGMMGHMHGASIGPTPGTRE